MATSSVAYNKPVLPRVSDTSDLASNRASVYSGKALDFDGVNDDVLSTITISGAKTYCAWINADGTSNERIISISTGGYSNITFTNNKFSMYDGTNIPETTTTFETDQWYFVVAVQEANNAKIYVNGISQPLNTTNWIEHTHTSATIAIGRDASGSSAWFDGQISGVRVFNTALTAAQVSELYNNPEQILPTGVSAVNLKLWLPMMEGAGSYVYNGAAGATGAELLANGTLEEVCQKWGLSDVSTIAITGGKIIWTNPASGGAFADQYISVSTGKTYRITFDYSASDSGFVYVGDQYVSIPSGAGTFTTDIAYTSGDARLRIAYGSSSALTASVDNVSVKEVVPQATGTISGATWVVGQGEPLPQTALMDWNKGTNLIFYSEDESGWGKSNGSGGSLPVVVEGQLDPLGGARAFRVKLVRTSASASYSQIYNTATSVSGTYTASCWFRAVSGSPTIGWNYNNSTWETITLTSEWQRFTTTRTMASGYPSSPNIIVYQSVAGTSLEAEFEMFGYQMELGSVANPYVKTLGSAQASPVLLPKGLTTGKDIFGNSIVTPRASGAFNFDGASWAEVHDNASLDITDAITLEAWVYWDGAQADKGIIGKWRGSDNLRGYLLYVQSLTEARFFVSSNGVDSYNVATSTTILNGWNHILGISDGSKIKIYLNGIFQNEVSASTIFSSSLPLEIGRFKTDSNVAYENEIALPRIYNYALTAEQVADNFNQKASTFGKTKVTGELQAYINRTVAAGATVEAHSALLNTLTELENK